MTQAAMLKDRKKFMDDAQEKILLNATVSRARAKAIAAGVKPRDIIAVILPFILNYLFTGKIDFAAIAAAILALIKG